MPQVGTTIFTEMSALASACGALNVAQGFPDLDTPEPLRAAVADAIEAGLKQVQPVTEEKAPVTDCRSVLGDIGNRDERPVATPRGKSVGVTWADTVRWGRRGAPSGIRAS